MVTNSSSNIPTGASGTILQGQGVGSNSAFSTSTYPATNAINTILYASSANVMAALATANTAVLITNGSGVPSWTSAGTSYTPTCIGSTTAGTTSYSTQTGRYVQIGPIVIAEFNVVGTFGGTAAGNVRVSLPSTIVSTNSINTYGAGVCSVNAATTNGSWQGAGNTAYVQYLTYAVTFAAVTASDSFNCQGTIVYFTG